MSTNKTTSAAATTAVTSTTVQPAVINGRPKIRPFSCPFVLIHVSCTWASGFRSAKSCVEWRDRKKAITNKKTDIMANKSPTKPREYKKFFNNNSGKSKINLTSMEFTIEKTQYHHGITQCTQSRSVIRSMERTLPRSYFL